MAELAKLSAACKPNGMSRTGYRYNSPVWLPRRIDCLKLYASTYTERGTLRLPSGAHQQVEGLHQGLARARLLGLRENNRAHRSQIGIATLIICDGDRLTPKQGRRERLESVVGATWRQSRRRRSCASASGAGGAAGASGGEVALGVRKTT